MMRGLIDNMKYNILIAFYLSTFIALFAFVGCELSEYKEKTGDAYASRYYRYVIRTEITVYECDNVYVSSQSENSLYCECYRDDGTKIIVKGSHAIERYNR